MPERREADKPYRTLLTENAALRRRVRALEEKTRLGPDTASSTVSNVVKLVEQKDRALERSYEELEKAHQQLRHSFESTVKYYESTVLTLAQLIEGQYPHRRQHSNRVADLARGIGRELGWDKGRLDALGTAGQLHDFGYIGVPPEVILKAGPWSPEDRKKAERHVRAARMVLEPIGVLERVLPWIDRHHENWDGTGYPDRISGGGIPVESRILRLADAWDGMTHDRPQRAAMTKKEALRVVKDEAGRKFDPDLVAILERLVK